MDHPEDHQSPSDLRQVLILRPPPVFSVHEQSFSNKFHILKAYDSPLPTHDFLRSHAQSVRVVLCSGVRPITAEVIRDLPTLQLVVSSATGVNHIDMAECRRRGITVTNVADVFSDDVADAAVGLLIDVMRRITAGDRFVRGGRWPVTGGVSSWFQDRRQASRDCRSWKHWFESYHKTRRHGLHSLVHLKAQKTIHPIYFLSKCPSTRFRFRCPYYLLRIDQ